MANFANLMHLTVNINTREISGVFWRPQNIILAKFLKNFQMFLNFLILFCLYSHQNQIVLNFSWIIQSNCLFVPLFLKKNWIYLSETFFRIYWVYPRWSKTPKKVLHTCHSQEGRGEYLGIFWSLFWHVRLRVTTISLSISWPCWGALGGTFGLIFSIPWETLNIFWWYIVRNF